MKTQNIMIVGVGGPIRRFPMLLAIDVGNSSISLGLFDLTATDPRPAPALTAKLSAATGRTADEYAVIIRGLLADKGPDLSCLHRL